MDGEYGAISATAEAVPRQLVRSVWRDLASILTGLAFTAAVAAVGTVLVTFALLAFWVFAPVFAITIGILIHRHRRQAARAAA